MASSSKMDFLGTTQPHAAVLCSFVFNRSHRCALLMSLPSRPDKTVYSTDKEKESCKFCTLSSISTSFLVSAYLLSLTFRKGSLTGSYTNHKTFLRLFSAAWGAAGIKIAVDDKDILRSVVFGEINR